MTGPGQTAYTTRFADRKPRDITPWEDLPDDAKATWARVEEAVRAQSTPLHLNVTSGGAVDDETPIERFCRETYERSKADGSLDRLRALFARYAQIDPALLQSDATARQRGKNLDGSARRETVDAPPREDAKAGGSVEGIATLVARMLTDAADAELLASSEEASGRVRSAKAREVFEARAGICRTLAARIPEAIRAFSLSKEGAAAGGFVDAAAIVLKTTQNDRIVAVGYTPDCFWPAPNSMKERDRPLEASRNFVRALCADVETLLAAFTPSKVVHPLDATGTPNSRVADAIEACDWSGAPIGNKAILRCAIERLRAESPPSDGGQATGAEPDGAALAAARKPYAFQVVREGGLVGFQVHDITKADREAGYESLALYPLATPRTSAPPAQPSEATVTFADHDDKEAVRSRDEGREVFSSWYPTVSAGDAFGAGFDSGYFFATVAAPREAGGGRNAIAQTISRYSFDHDERGGIILGPVTCERLADAILVALRDEAALATTAPAAGQGDECIPDSGEPSFTLLGRDPQAPDLIEQWARDRQDAEPGSPKPTRARRIAAQMRVYKLNNPEKGMAPGALPAHPAPKIESPRDLAAVRAAALHATIQLARAAVGLKCYPGDNDYEDAGRALTDAIATLDTAPAPDPASAGDRSGQEVGR